LLSVRSLYCSFDSKMNISKLLAAWSMDPIQQSNNACCKIPELICSCQIP
jgi:hypothetical protein